MGFIKVMLPELIGGDNPLTDALEDGRQPGLALLQLISILVLVEGHFDDRHQLFLLDRFEGIADRLGQLGPLKGVFIGVGGQVDNREAELIADLLGPPRPRSISRPG